MNNGLGLDVQVIESKDALDSLLRKWSLAVQSPWTTARWISIMPVVANSKQSMESSAMILLKTERFDLIRYFLWIFLNGLIWWFGGGTWRSQVGRLLTASTQPVVKVSNLEALLGTSRQQHYYYCYHFNCRAYININNQSSQLIISLMRTCAHNYK
jgi:hypothetical protein